MKIILLLDNSGSMDEKMQGGNETRHEAMLRVTAQALAHRAHMHGVIPVWTFGDKVTHVGSFAQPRDIIDAVSGLRREGGTRLWDALGQLMRSASTDVKTQLICITDGEDSGSATTRESVEQLAKGLPNLHLTLLIVGQQRQALTLFPGASVHSIGEETTGLEAVVSRALTEDSMKIDPYIQVSAPVFPLAKVDGEFVDLVQSAVKHALPYLEELTGLRYYPVPTFLAPDRTYTKEVLVEIAHAHDITDEVKEVVKFVSKMCITFHMRAYSLERPIPNDWEHPECYYGLYTDLAFEERLELVRVAEALGSWMEDYARAKDSSSGPEDRDELDYFESVMLQIIQILEGMLAAQACRVREERPEWQPNRELWHKILPQKYSRLVDAAIVGNGYWTRDLGPLVTLFRIALPFILERVQTARRENHRLRTVIEQIRAYGCYCGPGSTMEHEYAKAGLPVWAAPANTGKVILFVDPLRSAVSEVARDFPHRSAEELLRDVILSVVIHEHAHAIAAEGHDGTAICIQRGSAENTGVSETLAEWAELNYFRGDAVMREVIRLHAQSGRFPAWPYAGALLFERKYGAKGKRAFRKLLRLFRGGHVDNAYNMIVQG